VPREINLEADDYNKKLLKLIPSEIIAAYITVAGLIPDRNNIWLWGITIVLLVLVTPYLRSFQGVKKPLHYAVSSISFIVWVFAIGGPFAATGWYESWMGSVALILWTLVPPLFFGKPVRRRA